MVRFAQGIEELMMMTPFFDTTLVFYVHLTPSILHIHPNFLHTPCYLVDPTLIQITLCSIIQFFKQHTFCDISYLIPHLLYRTW